MRLRGLLVVAVGLLVAADTPKGDEAKKDQEKLQGKWQLVSFEQGGVKATGPDLGDPTPQLEFNENKYKVQVGEEKEEGTFTLDPTKSPKTIDLKITSGKDAGKDQLGIYKIEGEQLVFAFAPPGEKERPGEFASKEGEDTLVFVFERQKP